MTGAVLLDNIVPRGGLALYVCINEKRLFVRWREQRGRGWCYCIAILIDDGYWICNSTAVSLDGVSDAANKDPAVERAIYFSLSCGTGYH
jgi:hypothetical protein